MALILFFNLTTSFVMIWTATMLGRVCITDMNCGQGYRAPIAMRSQQHWDCAQVTAPQVFKGYGIMSALIIFSWDMAVIVSGLNVFIGMAAGMAVGSITFVAAILRIDRIVKEECGE